MYVCVCYAKILSTNTLGRSKKRKAKEEVEKGEDSYFILVGGTSECGAGSAWLAQQK